ncbi:uncharacterized protein LOC117604998 [Osmia lignaria lignaria]|uniref:uncharacterized protein LOC117604998 n=1 Tax=Osmia lignaria lignaria TaxID=1437193 RepID=UPI00402BDFCF
MKFLLSVLIAHVLQCVASRSNSDSYQEDSFSVFGWISYLKRLSLITLMISGVVLYYVPESRPHARKICRVLIDLTADGLKAVLSTREDEQIYEKIKSKYHRVKYEQSLAAQKRVSREVQDDEDFELMQKNQGKRAKMFVDGDGLLIGNREKKKINMKQCKEHRHSRQRLRGSFVKDISGESSTEVTKPVYFYSDKLEDLSKYFKNSLYGAKRPSEASVENYALLISGSPQQMAMLDEKYDKDDVVIVQDPYVKLEYRECGTSTDKLSSIAEASVLEQEGPTRDYNDHPTEPGMESYVKDVDLNSIPEVDSRFSVNKSMYQTSEYQCGGECCDSGCSDILGSSADTKNVLKSSRSMLSSKLHKKIEENNENLQASNYTKYNHEGGRFMKLSNLNSRKVDFRKEDKIDHSHQWQENGHQYESTCRNVRRKISRTNNPLKSSCCNDVSYFTDRSGEADDEISHLGERVTVKHDLDEKPQRENYLYKRNSDDSIFDHICNEFETEPILKNRVTPALIRAVNWIFGGCPEARKVGKEGSPETTGEWLL